MRKFTQYYDKLYKDKKDYAKEVEDIKALYEKHSNQPLTKILEIGCGTGNHTEELAKITEKVVAEDIDSERIEIARSKVSAENVEFHTSLETIQENNFPLSVLMWNIPFYIPDLDTLDKLFADISNKMAQGGLIMFDVWNGVTIIKAEPRSKKEEFKKDGERIIHNVTKETDLMNGKLRVTHNVQVYKGEEKIDEFTESEDHYIWTTKTLSDLLYRNGFKVLKISKRDDYEADATEDDWWTFFIAEKK